MKNASREFASEECGRLDAVLRTGLVSGRLKDTVHAGFEAFLEHWSAGRPDADVAFLRADPRRTIVAERITSALDAGTRAERERAFEILLDVQARGAAWRKSGKSAPRLADVRAALGEDHGLLVYLPAPEGVGGMCNLPDAGVCFCNLDH